MTDPFWMLTIMHTLGRDYIVWDRSATIDFLAPGREHVYAHFVLKPAAIDELRRAAAGGDKVLRWFEVDVTTKSGERIAQVRKQLYVRLKPRVRPAEIGRASCRERGWIVVGGVVVKRRVGRH